MGRRGETISRCIVECQCSRSDNMLSPSLSQICLAQNSEATGQYQLAFSYYKTGVGILLQGVQGDTNKARRDAVRRKTAQYLMKAEDLYNRHLASENLDERRWAVSGCLLPYVIVKQLFTMFEYAQF